MHSGVIDNPRVTHSENLTIVGLIEIFPQANRGFDQANPADYDDIG